MPQVKINPINFLPEELLEHIFDYLTKKELLRCSLVSKDWYETIGKLCSFLRRIQITYVENLLFDKELDCLLETSRKYKLLKIYTRENCGLFRERVMKILVKFSESIESINTSHEIGTSNIKLPKLRELIIFNNRSNSQTFRQFRVLSDEGIIKSIEFIEKLDLCIKLDADSIEMLKNALRTMKKLTFLRFGNAEHIDILDEKASYSFSLKEFHVHLQSYLLQKDYLKLFNFLKTQSATIKVLSVSSFKLKTEDIIDMLNYPNLQTLMIGGLQDIELEKYPLPINRTIKKLFDFTFNGSLGPLAPYMKNLTTLNTDTLSKSIIDGIPRKSFFKLNFSIIPDDVFEQAEGFLYCNRYKMKVSQKDFTPLLRQLNIVRVDYKVKPVRNLDEIDFEDFEFPNEHHDIFLDELR